MIPETKMWFQTLPDDIRNSCYIEDRIPRDKLLELMSISRVMLAPSLSDGIPNTLYEAMAAGAFPVVSPLDTIKCVVSDEVNALFARNLYPDEIADALDRSMNDDELVDCGAKNSFELVREIADRESIKRNVSDYYISILGRS